MALTAEPAGPGITVRVGKYLDINTAAVTRRNLREAIGQLPPEVVADLGGTEFMDMTGLAVLLGALRHARAHDVRLAVTCTREPILRLFQIAGVAGLLDIRGGRGGRPVLFFDIDGVFVPDVSGPPPAGYGGWTDRWAQTPQGPYRVLVNPLHGQWVTRLAAETGAEPVWASTWEENAGTFVSPALGLPPWPFVPGIRDLVDSGLSKVPAVRSWAAGRPFAWFEDKPSVAAELAGEPGCLVITVDAATGLRETHIAAARNWLLKRARPARDEGDTHGTLA